MGSTVIHICPQLPPAVCGVGDYALVLGRRMEDLGSDIQCRWIACGWKAAAAKEARKGANSESSSSRAQGMWSAINTMSGGAVGQTILILHYSGYGYDRSGAPTWLAEAIERRTQQAETYKVVTVFHELFATGLPWQRAFWLSGKQRRVAARIARASDAVVTNRESSAKWLEQQTGRALGSVPHIPVSSNIGEPATILPWDERPRVAVLFGQAKFKAPFFTGHRAKQTAELCRQHAITTWIDIGPAGASEHTALSRAGIRVQRLGYLPAASAAAHFANARFVLFDYFPGYLAKSSVLAAAAAHGVPP